MESKDTLWHINWGDNDNTFAIASNQLEAIDRMPDGHGLVNFAVPLHHIYRTIKQSGKQEGIREVVEWIKMEFPFSFLCIFRGERGQAKLKEWGVENG